MDTNGRRAQRPSPGPDHSVRVARLREWLNTGMWFLPMLWALGAILAALVLVEVDHRTGGDDPGWLVFGRGAENARNVLSVVAGATLTFTGTVFSITIVALQLASTQFSPRVLRTFLRDRASQHCFGVFVATALYSLMVLRDVGEEVPVPGLAVTGAFVMVLASIFAFVYLVHHVANSIRAVSIMEAVAAETRESIRANFPTDGDDADDDPEGAEPDWPEPTQVVTLDRGPGNLLGVDEDDLIALARRHNCVLELLPAVGDYLPSNVPVFLVRGGDGEVRPGDVLEHVGTGPERTLFQDTLFGFRQLVDIAEKALSPGINDPTTAVQAIDRLHDLLRRLAVRPMHHGRYHDEDGALRLVVRAPRWEHFVHLAFDEIRHYGIGSIQVPRRLRAALLDLKRAAPAERHPALDEQLDALEQAVTREYDLPEERRLALGADAQGLR